MVIAWADSAQKHSPIADALHAIRHRVALIVAFDVAQDGAGEVVDLIIGPSRDGPMLEVLPHRRAPRITSVFHVLHLRRTTWERAQTAIARRKEQEKP